MYSNEDGEVCASGERGQWLAFELKSFRSKTRKRRDAAVQDLVSMMIEDVRLRRKKGIRWEVYEGRADGSDA